MFRQSNQPANPCHPPAPAANQSVRRRHRQSPRPPLATTAQAQSIRGPGRRSNESAAGARADRRADGVLWKNRRENGLMHDRPALVDPFFSAAGSTARGTYGRAVDAPQFVVDFAQLHAGSAEAIEDFVQCPVGIPLVEEIPGGRPRAELLGQVAPGRTGSQNPQNGIDDRPSIARFAARFRGRWKDVANTIPLFIRQPMSYHHDHPPWFGARERR